LTAHSTQIPLTTLTRNAITAIPDGTPIDVTNGMYIDMGTTTIPAGPGSENLTLFIQTTNGADKTVTIKAGVGGGATAGQAFRSPLGDLVLTALAANGGGVIGGLESSRFMQLNGRVYIDFASGTTGTITAFCGPGHQ
jgi:hypothetical protein